MNDINSCRAAFSQTDITPEFPVEMIVCYREDNRPDGVLHPLCAQVLLFEYQTVRCCLIAIDSLGLTTALSYELRAMVADVLGTAAINVMLNFSHTHSAPAPKSPLNGRRYFTLLCDRVVACVRDAIKLLQPCLAGWSVGETDIGENRRDGCSIVDKRLGALQVINAINKTPITVLLRVCAHANILMTGSSKLSSDYVGAARDKISARFGCPVMLVQGAAGNIKPSGVDKINGGDISDVDRISDMLLQSAAQLRFEPKEVTRLFMCEKAIELQSDVPLEDEAKEIAVKAGIDAEGWLAECARLRSTGASSQIQDGSIYFLFLNEGCLCGVPDEIFCEVSLAVVDQTQSPLLFFNGYTNGCTGYLPHREEWAKGGYETFDSYLIYYVYHGHVLPYRADTAEKLVNTVVATWKDNDQD
jgi:hypothetical protein